MLTTSLKHSLALLKSTIRGTVIGARLKGNKD